MKRKKSYKDMNKYHEAKRKWQERYRENSGSGKFGRRHWTEAEDRLVLEQIMTDRELGVAIKRSITAIQMRRYKLKLKGKDKAMSKGTNIRKVNGVDVITYSKEMTYACVGEVEAGTTGIMGGDTGHGGRTYIRFQDLGGVDIDVNVTDGGYGNLGLTIELGGDHELDMAIESLEFILAVLKDGRTRE